MNLVNPTTRRNERHESTALRGQDVVDQGNRLLARQRDSTGLTRSPPMITGHLNLGPVSGHSLLERRIIELLTTTNLTFKEIIFKLEAERLNASIGLIRRINRDNRYRRPRYDSKLSPAQRESLVEELRDHQGVKPNLSLLAKRYGVCHGSVWYWWDKLNRIRRRQPFRGTGVQQTKFVAKTHQSKQQHNHRQASTTAILERSLLYLNRQDRQHYRLEGGGLAAPAAAAAAVAAAALVISSVGPQAATVGQLLKAGAGDFGPQLAVAQPQTLASSILLGDRYNLVGRVSVVSAQNTLNLIELPILMLTKRVHGQTESKAVPGSGRQLEREAESPPPVLAQVSVGESAMAPDRRPSTGLEDETAQ